MLILVAVTVSYSIGENSILTQAIKSKFYQEMQAINEQKTISKLENFTSTGIKKVKSDFWITEKLTENDIKKFSSTLKTEIVFTRKKYLTENGIINTKQMWKYNAYDVQELVEDPGYLETLIEGIHYISPKFAEKNKKFIYDEETDTCYKIADTKIGKNTVHSLEYLNYLLSGTIPENLKVVTMVPEIVESSDGIRCYEPNLNNFKYSTQVIYYSSDSKIEYPISIEEYLKDNKPRTISNNEKTYTFFDYSSEKKMWANIKTTNNDIIAYWVWIPRYAYKIENNIITIEYVDLNSNALNLKDEGGNLLTKQQLEEQGYTLHEAFSQGDGLTGIWFSKYNVSTKEVVPTSVKAEPPDMSDFNSSTTKLIYYNPKNLADTKEVEYTTNPTQTKEIDGKIYYFYDYENKIWANIKCLNENSDKIKEDDLESYWVWIPKFAYKIEGGATSVILIDENNKPIDTETYGNAIPARYTIHEAFLQGDGLKGIWFSKYNVSIKETLPQSFIANKPNMSNFNSNITKLVYYNPKNLADIKEVEYTTNPTQTKEIDGKIYYFYDYENKIWANVKCLNTNNEGAEDDLESYWVWIPRYAYKIESGKVNIILVDLNNKPIDITKYGQTLPQGYTLHEAFSQGDGLTGIWFSKYNVSKKEI